MQDPSRRRSLSWRFLSSADEETAPRVELKKQGIKQKKATLNSKHYQKTEHQTEKAILNSKQYKMGTDDYNTNSEQIKGHAKFFHKKMPDLTKA